MSSSACNSNCSKQNLETPPTLLPSKLLLNSQETRLITLYEYFNQSKKPMLEIYIYFFCYHNSFAHEHKKRFNNNIFLLFNWNYIMLLTYPLLRQEEKATGEKQILKLCFHILLCTYLF